MNTKGGDMPYKVDLANFIADWWQFGAFIAVSVIAFLVGKERQRFKVDQIGKEVEAQGRRIEKLERQGNAEAVQLGQIVTSQTYIISTLDEIKESLRGKVDK